MPHSTGTYSSVTVDNPLRDILANIGVLHLQLRVAADELIIYKVGGVYKGHQ
jgi:hypothetical protein